MFSFRTGSCKLCSRSWPWIAQLLKAEGIIAPLKKDEGHTQGPRGLLGVRLAWPSTAREGPFSCAPHQGDEAVLASLGANSVRASALPRTGCVRPSEPQFSHL